MTPTSIGIVGVAPGMYVDDFVARPAIRDDLTYLRSDEQLLSLVTALSDFGQAARYYNLDVVSGKDPQYPSPEEAWNEIENAISYAS